MRVLVRIYIPQKDKANIEVKSEDQALKLLKQTKDNESQRVKWLGNEDVYFKGTKDYYRIIK